MQGNGAMCSYCTLFCNDPSNDNSCDHSESGCSDAPDGDVWDDIYDCSSDDQFSTNAATWTQPSPLTTNVGTTATINTDYKDLFTKTKEEYCPLRYCYASYYDSVVNTNCAKNGYDPSIYGVSIDSKGQITVSRNYRM